MARYPLCSRFIAAMSEERPLNIYCFQKAELGYFPCFSEEFYKLKIIINKRCTQMINAISLLNLHACPSKDLFLV